MNYYGEHARVRTVGLMRGCTAIRMPAALPSIADYYGVGVVADPDAAAETPEQEPMTDLASAVRRLGHAVITRRLGPAQARDLTARLEMICAEIEPVPPRTKAENFGLRNRIATFMETGDWPDPPPDGGRIEFDVASMIGGELNPFSMGARYFRDGNEVVGRVTVGPCFEGPPGRVHGGVICAVFDEVMGCVFRATGTPSAFTGELSVRFEAPASLETELEFRARLVSRDGRKNYLEGEATGSNGRVATATATFIEMLPEHFLDSVDGAAHGSGAGG